VAAEDHPTRRVILSDSERIALRTEPAQEQTCLEVPKTDWTIALRGKHTTVRTERHSSRTVLSTTPVVTRHFRNEELPATRRFQIIPQNDPAVIVRCSERRTVIAEGERNGPTVESQRVDLAWVCLVGDVPY